MGEDRTRDAPDECLAHSKDWKCFAAQDHGRLHGGSAKQGIKTEREDPDTWGRTEKHPKIESI